MVKPAEPREEISAELANGTRLDERYEIVRPLGRGGMGVVYLARDHDRDGSLVALKLLPAELTADPHGLALLKQEASVAMRLSHPNIVRLHNLEGRTRKYVTMEYVDGGSLADLLIARTRGQLPRPPSWTGAGLSPFEVVPLLDGIAAGLDYAHSERVIHRDMKPANVLVKRRGDTIVPKVADFGIAREIREMVSRATQNVVAGTPSYMSPEHYRGEKIDARADVYSVAATVYTLLAARPPFKGGELSWQILNKEPDPIHGVAPNVLAVVKRGMAKDARGRPDSCGAFAALFRQAVNDAGAGLDVETLNPDVPTTTTPSPKTPAPTTPAANPGDTPTTRPAEHDPADEITAKPPPTDAIPVPPVRPDLVPETMKSPPVAVPLADGPTAPVLAARSGRPIALAACVLLASALAFRGWSPTGPRPLATSAADAKSTIGDLVHENRLREAVALLMALSKVSVADGRDGLGLGFALARQGESDLARQVFTFVITRNNEMIPTLRATADQRFARDPARERQGLHIAATVLRDVDPDDAWPLRALAKLNGVPDRDATLSRARDLLNVSDYPAAIALVRPLANDPEAAIVLCIALAHTSEGRDEARKLLAAVKVDDVTDVRALIGLEQAAVQLQDWRAALTVANRWRYVDGSSAQAALACALALDKLGEEARAAAMRVEAMKLGRKTPPAPKLGP